MSKERINIPQADMLMGSMRSMGYSFESAIADVIDNSISANAQNIKVLFPTSPLDNMAVGILDDGTGMDDDTLFEAMRYGSSSSEKARSKNDLGRFGLGLKSASLSQCRILTVISYFHGKLSAYRWDFNYVKETKKWSVFSLNSNDCLSIPYIEYLEKQKQGTLVVWTDFDILSKSNDGQVYETLNQLKDSVSTHLSLIFHRFMARVQNRITFYVNNQNITPLDPFLESHQKTTTLKEKTIAVTDSNNKEQQIKIRPFILPYLSDLSAKDKKLMGGVEDMRSKQGFYVYRNERLIIWGNWFRMTRRNELTKNARIRVDIPNTLDDIWSIDIKKQVAQIPRRIQNQLTKMVNDALDISVNKHTHRGRRNNIEEDIDYIWDRIEGRNNNFYYKVNRNSEVVKYIFNKLSDEDIEYVNLLITEIEKNVPTQQIYLDRSNDHIIVEEENDREDDLYEMAISMIDATKGIGSTTIDQKIEKLMQSEPFRLYKNIGERLKSYYSNEVN